LGLTRVNSVDIARKSHHLKVNRHFNVISDLHGGAPRKLGEKPRVSTDIKGFFIEKFTAISSIGTHSALLAMRGNEQLTTSRYNAALDLQDLPESTKQVIRGNYADEQRHLEWIKSALDRKVWEEERPASR
jgi:hypothetical protein